MAAPTSESLSLRKFDNMPHISKEFAQELKEAHRKSRRERKLQEKIDAYNLRCPGRWVTGFAVAIICFALVSAISGLWAGRWTVNPNFKEGAATIAAIVSNTLTIISAGIIIMAAVSRKIPLIFTTMLGLGTVIILSTVIICSFFIFYDDTIGTEASLFRRLIMECESNSTAVNISSIAKDESSEAASMAAFVIFSSSTVFVLTALICVGFATWCSITAIIEATEKERKKRLKAEKERKQKEARKRTYLEETKEEKQKWDIYLKETEVEKEKQSIIEFGLYLKRRHRTVHLILVFVLFVLSLIKGVGLAYIQKWTLNTNYELIISAVIEASMALLIAIAGLPLYFLDEDGNDKLMIAGLCCVACIFLFIVPPSISSTVIIIRRLLSDTYFFENYKCDNGNIILEKPLTTLQISGLTIYYILVFVCPILYAFIVWNSMGIVRYYRDDDLHYEERMKLRKESEEREEKERNAKDNKSKSPV